MSSWGLWLWLGSSACWLRIYSIGVQSDNIISPKAEMTSTIDSLIAKLKELNLNLQFIKKTINRDQCISTPSITQHFDILESDRPRLEKCMDTVAGLAAEIKEKFDSGNFPNTEKLKVAKLKSDFEKKMNNYSEMLDKLKTKKTKELRELRQTINRRSVTTRDKSDTYYGTGRRGSDDEDHQGPAIELQEVNQETLFYERMIQLKEKELLEIKQKMEEALKVQTEVGKLVREQGKQLDIIEDNVDSARSNVKEAGQLLEEGVQHHKSANRKKMCIIGVVFVLLLVIIIPILVKVL